MIVLAYTSSHLIKQQESDEMRGSVCLDNFMECGTSSSFLHCMNKNILLKLVFIYTSLEFHARLVLKDRSHFVPRRIQNEHATHCFYINGPSYTHLWSHSQLEG